MGYWKYEIVHDYNATQLIKEFREENLALKNSKGTEDDELDFIVYAEKDDFSINLGRVLLIKMSDAMVTYYCQYKDPGYLPKFWAKYIYEQNKDNKTFNFKEDEISDAFLESIKLQTKLLLNISIVDAENFIKNVSEAISKFIREELKFTREQWDPTLKSEKYLFAKPENAVNYFTIKCDSIVKKLKEYRNGLELFTSFNIAGFKGKLEVAENIIKAIDGTIKSIEKLKKWLIENKEKIEHKIPLLCGVWNGMIEVLAGTTDVIFVAISILLGELDHNINLEYLEIRESIEEILSTIFTDPAKVIEEMITSIQNYKYSRYDDPKLNEYQLQYNIGEDVILAINIIVTIATIIKGTIKLAKLLPKFTKWIDEVLVKDGKGARKLKNALAIDIIKLSDEAEELLKKYADNAVLGYTKLKRPSVVSVLEGKNRKVFAYSNKAKLSTGEIPKGFHPLVKEWLNEIADKNLILRRTHGKCAEPAAISKWLWEIDPKGKMKIEQARIEFEGVVSKAIKIEGKKIKLFEHATHKIACDSCNPLLKYFNIKEVH